MNPALTYRLYKKANKLSLLAESLKSDVGTWIVGATATDTLVEYAATIINTTLLIYPNLLVDRVTELTGISVGDRNVVTDPTITQLVDMSTGMSEIVVVNLTSEVHRKEI